MPLPQGTTILDIGCGGGEPVARYLIDRGFNIVGIDINPDLIALARTRFPQQDWHVGDMRTVTIEQCFAAALLWNSLHLLSRADQGLMAQRTASWLSPGGRLLFNVEPAAAQGAEGCHLGARFREGLDAADYSATLTRNGMVEIAHIENDRTCAGAGVWLVRKV